MIGSLRLASAPCFGDGVNVGPLGQVNFIFGPNGSGKTTISRAMADPTQYPGTTFDWTPASTPLSVKVYNRDYVSTTLGQAGTLPGVFFLGTGSQNVRDEIEELSGEGGLIPRLEKNLLRDRTSLGDASDGTGKLGEIRAARSRLTEASWGKRGDMGDALRLMFEGTKASKAKFLEKILDVASTRPAIDTDITALTRDAASVFDAGATVIAELTTLVEPEPEMAEGFDLLETAIQGNEKVTLAVLIDELGNSDWVSQGRPYFDHAGGRCPFCQQGAPINFAEELRSYFDSLFSKRIASLARFIEWYEAQVHILHNAVQAATDRSVAQLDNVAFAAARTSLEAALATNVSELRKKQASPSIVVKLVPIGSEVAAINTVIDAANGMIREHNALVRDHARARRALTDRCWRYFVGVVIAPEVAVFENVMPGLLGAQKSLESRIARTLGEIETAGERLRELERQIRSSRAVIEDINAILASVGFDSFSLAPSLDLADGYSLIRPGNSSVAESLSEGEGTFITFLYFLQQLQGQPGQPGESRNIVAVIDDPISSLDSDIMFVVGTLIKRLIAGIRRGEGRVRQLVILTHNVYFHKEVTFVRRTDSAGGRQFFVLRKRAGKPSELIQHGERNPITTAYRSLWEVVRVARQDPPQSPVALQNVMRRIIENYFRVLGEIDEQKILDMLGAKEQSIGQSLFLWVNEGSHSIIEEFEYSPTGVSTEAFLDTFEAIFDRAGHRAHYLMMMNGGD